MSGFAGLRVHARAPFLLLFFCLGVGGPSRAPRPLSFERGMAFQMRQNAFCWPSLAEGVKKWRSAQGGVLQAWGSSLPPIHRLPLPFFRKDLTLQHIFWHTL